MSVRDYAAAHLHNGENWFTKSTNQLPFDAETADCLWRSQSDNYPVAAQNYSNAHGRDCSLVWV